MADNDECPVNNNKNPMHRSSKEIADKRATGESGDSSAGSPGGIPGGMLGGISGSMPGSKLGGIPGGIEGESNFKKWHRICFGVTPYRYDENNGIVCQDFKEPGVVHVVPIVNVLYDIFFDAPALPDQVKDTLNVIGLVSSLMLSIAVGLLFSFGFDDWVDAITRLSIQDRNLDPYLR